MLASLAQGVYNGEAISAGIGLKITAHQLGVGLFVFYKQDLDWFFRNCRTLPK